MIQTFTVTAEDIATGVPMSETNCALAKCLRRSGFPNAHVGVCFIYPLGTCGVWMPNNAYEFRSKFDRILTKRPDPITFDLEIPDA